MLRITDIQDNSVDWETVPFVEIDEEKVENYLLSNNDILFARTGATVGKSFLIKNLKNKSVFASYLIRIQLKEKLNAQFVKYFFESDYYWEQIEDKSVGTGQPNVNGTLLSNLQIPIPSLAEQLRIVTIIESTFVLIDDVESNKLSLSQFIKQAKSKVLDLAIHGKLVPQNPNDEPASTLLEKIKIQKTPAAISHYPFEVPKGWRWCKLGEIFQIIMGQSPDGYSVTNNSQGIEFHQGKLCFSEKYIEKSNFYTDNPTRIVEPNSLLLCVRAPVGIVNITLRRICIGRGLCAIKVPEKMDILFAFYWLKTLENTFNQKATGSTFTAISGDIIKNESIPIPPLAEQQRIVSKIEQIFVRLEQIENAMYE